MDHLKPHWFVRLLAWIDFAIEFTLAVVIFILAVLVLASLVEMRTVESFLANLLIRSY
jgi:hypothetical protein